MGILFISPELSNVHRKNWYNSQYGSLILVNALDIMNY